MKKPFKLDQTMKYGRTSGGLGIEVLYPGLATGSDDSGLGAIGRIDHARFQPGSIVPMHPHKDDEILTYLRSGEITHRDTVGHVEDVTPQRLMLMNAGHTFQHEEQSHPASEPLTALQIFMRPHATDLEPMVQFHDFGAIYSVDDWRLIAGPHDAPLVLRNDASIFDARLTAGTILPLPAAKRSGLTYLLYVFEGHVSLSGQELRTGESLILDGADYDVTALSRSDLVLFMTDPVAPIFSGGMFSGNVASKMR
ncbi:pirin family protein [Gluconobacter wancherniae]|uniref:pirin family protein n=1 Tax=Gluconobacter wancherniae TaxID=1307955 RepID=UPI001B8D76B1|nr:pirin family protein [Gluconobacter wancherniae]MBS1095188.1 pirin family protein [Gluconobacter wancherniae]